MAKLTVHTPFNIDVDFNVASLQKRAIAYFIDILIVSVYVYIISLTVFGNGMNMPGVFEISSLFLIVLPVYFYHPLCEIFMNGQSFGKKIMGIRVVNEKGNAATISQYLLRWILSIPNLVSVAIAYYLFLNPLVLTSVFILAVPDIISIAISDSGKRIADRAAGTVVVETRYRMPIEDTIFREYNENTSYTVKFPEVMQLTDRDINSLRNLLTQKRTADLTTYVAKVAARIEEVLKVHNNSGDPYYFFEELLNDYNFLTQQKTNH